MTLRISVKAGDSPKIYTLLRNIYGEPLDVAVDDLSEFTYSVYRVLQGARYPVENFVDVPIPVSCFHQEPVPYPENIVGLSTAEKNANYNVEVFPYLRTTVEGVSYWVSPFTIPGGLYELKINIRYTMDDPALEGVALIDKSFVVQVSVEGR